MPNWCENSILITGPKETMKVFYKTLSRPNNHGDKVAFSLYQTIKNGDNWGVDRDVDGVVILEQSSDSFLIRCYSAWNPPIKWAECFCEKYSGLKVRIAYYEGSMGFYGVWKCIKTKDETKTVDNKFTTADEDYEYFYTDEDGNAVKVTGEDEYDDIQPGDYLKRFMKKYSIRA